MAKSKKYYVVWEGHEPGVYDSWAVCQNQIKNYAGAKYKSFKSKAEAEDAFYGNFGDYIGSATKKSKPKQLSEADKSKIVWNSLSVDAACSGNPGVMEYRGVDTKTGYEFFRVGPFHGGTNNIGEFLALVHGLALLKKEGKTIPIYSDSRTGMAWVRNKKVKTTLKKTVQNAPIFELVDRALVWLNNNTYSTKILKWDTKGWGEIPADFGRK